MRERQGEGGRGSERGGEGRGGEGRGGSGGGNRAQEPREKTRIALPWFQALTSLALLGGDCLDHR